MHKLILLSVIALSFGGCYTKLASDGDYWGYTGRAKRDRVVIVKERTDTVIVTSQDTIVTEPTVIEEAEPEKTIIINNYYPEYSVYAVRPFGYRHWYHHHRPSVSFSITFGDPYPYYPYYHYPVYHHYRPYWSWWDRSWYYDPYYYHPYYAWHHYDPWWGNPYTCLRPSYDPWGYYDYPYYGHGHYGHHHNYGSRGDDRRDNRRRGRIGGEDRAGNSNTPAGSGPSRAGKSVSSAAPSTGSTAVRVSKQPDVQIVTDNTEGVRTTASPAEVSNLTPTSGKTVMRGSGAPSNVTAPESWPSTDAGVRRSNSSGTASTPAEKTSTVGSPSSSGSVRAGAPSTGKKPSVVYTTKPRESARASEPASRPASKSSESRPTKSSGSYSGSSTSSSSPSPTSSGSSGSYSGGRSSSGSSSSGSSSSGGSSSSSSGSSGGSSSGGGRASRSSR